MKKYSNERYLLLLQNGSFKIAHCIMLKGRYGQNVTKPLSISDHDQLVLNMAEQFNITLKTAAELPWSNSMVERHNDILAKTIVKLILDSKTYSVDVDIAWAVNAKNSLHNCYGYSPNEWAFGHNPSLTLFLVNDLPAINECANDLLKKHVNAMSESHKAFLVMLSNSFKDLTC